MTKLIDHYALLPPEQHGKLGAHVGGGNPLFPMLRDYVRRTSTVQVPATCNRDDKDINYGMLANDQIGDCVIAAIYHAIMHMHKGAGKPIPSPDVLTALTVKVYSAITGYVPGDPSSDNGTDPTQAWTYWRKHGVPWPDPSGAISEHKIIGSAQVLPHDGMNLKRGIYEFDCVGLSLNLPLAWQRMGVWDAGGDPASPQWQPGGWGGHEVLGVSYDTEHIAIITWGGVKLMTWRGWGTYGTLALCHLTRDQIASGGVSQTGVDLAALAVDLQAL